MGNHELESHSNVEKKEIFVVRRMVVKIGSSTITAEEQYLDREFIDDIARQASILFHSGVKIAIVSSGAIANGNLLLRDLKNADRDRQLVALSGQSELTYEWFLAFKKYGVLALVRLIAESDLEKTKGILYRAMDVGVPIINGDDVINDIEKSPISSDNDRLAGFVSHSINADASVFLTDVDGLMDTNGELINFVDRLEDIQEYIQQKGRGTGGMWGKCVEAKHLARLGQRSIIANGKTKDVLLRIAKGENLGTRFGKGWMLY